MQHHLAAACELCCCPHAPQELSGSDLLLQLLRASPPIPIVVLPVGHAVQGLVLLAV